MRIYLLIILTTFFFISGCKNKTAIPSENIDFKNAFWICDKKDIPVADSLFYKDNPAPLFRKEFSIKKEVKNACLFITAAGYYHASINGEKIGKNILDPAWTNFSKRIYYSEFDLTSRIKTGANCLGVFLGNGFYNPLPMTMWGNLNLRQHLSVGNPVFIAKLKLDYTDGSIEEIVTDRSWKFSYGPILKNNVYLGEVYDARKEIKDWDLAGFNDVGWKKSIEKSGPGGLLQNAFFPPVQVTDTIKPVRISVLPEGFYLVDMGVNFTGNYKIHLTGNPGNVIRFRFGERVYENGTLNPMTSVAGQIKSKGMGGSGAPAVAWQTDRFIFGDKTDVWYNPAFSFHTYRYMEISGLKKQPELADIEGLAFNTNVEDKNLFNCSSELLNSIQKACKRTFLNNLQSVQSDCPAREKFGYGGDLNAIGESYIYNFNMKDFYRKTIYDWLDAMTDSVFIDTAPYVGIKYCGLSWESAFILIQYKLYLYYNDTALIREFYQADLKWMEKAKRMHPSGIVDKGLGDHESFIKFPPHLIGTTHYLQCALVMKKFASIMNDKENEKRFDDLAKDLGNKVRVMFWKQPVPDPINRQTLFSTLLYHDLIPDNEKNATIDSLNKNIAKAPSGHFTTGIFGTKYILEALSSVGKVDNAYNIVNSTASPGWGYMIDRGATTVWETWKESDNVYSNCHPMFGTVSEWMYRWLAGIRPDPENPGFRKFIIAPNLPDGLEYVNCSYHSPFGKIVSSWKNLKNRQEYDIIIPVGSSALVKLPVNEQQKINLKEKNGNNAFSPVKEDKQHVSFELKEGEYSIVVI